MTDQANVPEMEDESSASSSFDSDESSMDSAMADEAQRLMDALQGGGTAAAAAAAEAAEPTKPPEEVWAEFVGGLESNSNASIKVTDTLVEWMAEMPNDAQRAAHVETACTDLIRAIESAFVVIHVILGRLWLSLLSPEQQERLYKAIVSKHAKTITYWKLGSDDSTETCGIPTTALLQCMSSTSKQVNNLDQTLEWSNLTELEIRGLELTTTDELEMILEFLKKCPKIRQFNLLGMVMSEKLVTTEGIFDKLVVAVQKMAGFDELQLCRKVMVHDNLDMSSSSKFPPLVTPSAMKQLLVVKPKWWRIALDGMGLDDRHLDIIGMELRNNKDCKMNDLLSIKDNPKITHKGLQSLYRVCLSKQRMGLILSDDPSWVATFDLVRPLNNLHRRLEYMKDDGSGGYRCKDSWIKWLDLVGHLDWVGEARKLNYTWFALLEQPELIYDHDSS